MLGGRGELETRELKVLQLVYRKVKCLKFPTLCKRIQ